MHARVVAAAYKDGVLEVVLPKAEEAKERLFRQAISLGGTLSGEHGIGLSKKAYMRFELNDETLELMKKIKNVFDPNHILNPGKIFPA